MTAGAVWLMALGMAFFAYAFRASFLLFGERITLPPLLRRSLDYVPAAVLAALVLPVFIHLGAPWGPDDTARLIAGVLAAAVAYRTRSVPATLAVGMVALWLALWLVPGA